jgi:hypothetical protein
VQGYQDLLVAVCYYVLGQQFRRGSAYFLNMRDVEETLAHKNATFFVVQW